MLGKTTMDPKEAVAEYRRQLEQAGINKVIEEVKSQLANFKPVGK
jgi:putative aldouronate transport system substrate-binding protein